MLGADTCQSNVHSMWKQKVQCCVTKFFAWQFQLRWKSNRIERKSLFHIFARSERYQAVLGQKIKPEFLQVDTESHEPLPDGGLPVRGDELALRRGRVYPAKDPHRRILTVWRHLLQDSWGAFSSFCDCFLNFSCCFFPSLLSQSLHYRANPIWNQSDLKLRLLSCNLDVPSPKFDAVRTQAFRFGRQFHPMKIKSHSLDTIKKSCYFTLKQSLGWR